MQVRGVRLAREERLQTTLPLRRIPFVDGDEGGSCDGVGGMRFEDPRVVPGRLVPATGPRRKRGEPEVGIPIPGLVHEHDSITPALPSFHRRRGNAR